MQWNEADRLAALRAYAILDTAPEAAFNDFVRLAAAICDAPISVINLIDEGANGSRPRSGLA